MRYSRSGICVHHAACKPHQKRLFFLTDDGGTKAVCTETFRYRFQDTGMVVLSGKSRFLYDRHYIIMHAPHDFHGIVHNKP